MARTIRSWILRRCPARGSTTCGRSLRKLGAGPIGWRLDATQPLPDLADRGLSSRQRGSTVAGARIGKTHWCHFDAAAGWKARAPVVVARDAWFAAGASCTYHHPQGMEITQPSNGVVPQGGKLPWDREPNTSYPERVPSRPMPQVVV